MNDTKKCKAKNISNASKPKKDLITITYDKKKGGKMISNAEVSVGCFGLSHSIGRLRCKSKKSRYSFLDEEKQWNGESILRNTISCRADPLHIRSQMKNNSSSSSPSSSSISSKTYMSSANKGLHETKHSSKKIVDDEITSDDTSSSSNSTPDQIHTMDDTSMQDLVARTLIVGIQVQTSRPVKLKPPPQSMYTSLSRQWRIQLLQETNNTNNNDDDDDLTRTNNNDRFGAVDIDSPKTFFGTKSAGDKQQKIFDPRLLVKSKKRKVVQWSDEYGQPLKQIHEVIIQKDTKCRIFIVLMNSPVDENEFLHCEFDTHQRIRISDILKQLPILRQQMHTEKNTSRSNAETKKSRTTAVRIHDIQYKSLCILGKELINMLSLQDYFCFGKDESSWLFRDGMIFFAIRQGCSNTAKVLRHAEKLIEHTNITQEMKKALTGSTNLQTLQSSEELLYNNNKKYEI